MSIVVSPKQYLDFNENWRLAYDAACVAQAYVDDLALEFAPRALAHELVNALERIKPVLDV